MLGRQKKRKNSIGAKKSIFVKSSFAKNEIVLFLAKFLVIFFILTFLINSVDLSFFSEKEAALVAGVVGLQSQGNAVFLSEKTFFVTNNCLGLITASILAALIFSFKKPDLKKKLGLFAAGFVLIMVVNVFRLWFVLFSATNGFDAELVHTVTWFFMSGVVLFIWYYGSKKCFGKEVYELA